jgi:pimeloyl-ACP methyl ester carboxylesterase
MILGMTLLSACKDDTPQKENTENINGHESGYAMVNGIKMYYEIHGKGGMPLVLIHGGGSTIETTFGNILPSLSGYGKVIAVELQAHGHTNDRNSPETFQQDAEDVAALCRSIGITKADFFGFSNGGNTAIQIALSYPGLVNKLVLASTIYKREGMIPGFFEGLEKGSLENMPALLKSAYLKVAPDTSLLQVMHDKDKARMIQFKNWTEDEMRSIQAPVLVILGDHDVVTTAHALEMSQVLPHAELMILPGNHGSYLGEICSVKKDSKIPAMTVVVVEEFLKK